MVTMSEELLAICPECGAKNTVRRPDIRAAERVALLLMFDCHECEQRVTVPVGKLEPFSAKS